MRIKLLILTILILFLEANSAFAVTVTISNIPSTISDEPFTFNVSVSGAQSGTNYLRANFFPTSTTSYFGYTYNGSSFVNSSTCSDYPPITIDSSGNWDGTLQAKIDTSSGYYSGAGTYSFKVRRYTQSCSSSYTWSNELTTTVSISTPTPSPSSSPSPTATPSPTPSSTSSSSSSSTSTFIISNIPSQIDSTESFNALVHLSLSNSPNTNLYLKGAFKQKDGTNYFGQTKVNGSWIKNNKTYSDQYKITTDSNGNWAGNLEIMPDIMDSGYEGTGEYIFKTGRYTDDGSLNWSNETTIKINAQEIELNNESSVLGIKETQNQKDETITSTKPVEKYSLEKYTKVSTPSFQATSSANPKTETKGTKQINFLSLAGKILVIIGAIPIIYAIYNKFRKRNKRAG